jgi:hypothetical protein
MTTNTCSMTGPAERLDERLAGLDGAGLLALVQAGLRRLGGEVLGGTVTEGALRATIVGLARVEAMAGAERLRRVRAADERAGGGASVVEKLAGELGLTRGQARQEAVTARQLGRLPATAGKLADGKLTLREAARVAGRVAELDELTAGSGGLSQEALADLDDTVVDTAGAGTVDPARLRGELDAWRHRTAEEALAEREQRQRAARRGFVREDPDGMVEVHAWLAPAFGGAEVRTAIDALSRPRVGDDRTYRQRVADALGEIARIALASDGLPAVQGHRPHVLMITTPQAAAGEPGAAPAHVDGVGDVSTAVAQRILCDADVTEVALARNGAVLDAGRTRREPSARQRAAVIARDRACVGCGVSVATCQLHHVRWWRDGGTTDVDNLVLICWGCHTAVHHDGWVVWQEDGRWRAGPASQRRTG